MGPNRRLQTEIDRCMKRVSDGQHDFQELWLKLEAMETVSKCILCRLVLVHVCNRASVDICT